MSNEKMSEENQEEIHQVKGPSFRTPIVQLCGGLVNYSFLPMIVALIFVIAYGAEGVGRGTKPKIHDWSMTSRTA